MPVALGSERGANHRLEPVGVLGPQGRAKVAGVVARQARVGLGQAPCHAVHRYDHDGSGGEPVALPEAGSLAGLSGLDLNPRLRAVVLQLDWRFGF